MKKIKIILITLFTLIFFSPITRATVNNKYIGGDLTYSDYTELLWIGIIPLIILSLVTIIMFGFFIKNKKSNKSYKKYIIISIIFLIITATATIFIPVKVDIHESGGIVLNKYYEYKNRKETTIFKNNLDQH